MLFSPHPGGALALLLAAAIAWPTTSRAQSFEPHHLFVASTGQSAVLEFDRMGDLVRSFADETELQFPAGLAFGPDGLLYVSSRDTDRVVVFDPNGNVVDTLGGNGQLMSPAGLAFGPDGNLYVCSFGGDSVVAFGALGGELLRIDQTTGLDGPKGISFGPNGHLYVSSLTLNVIFEFDPSGQRVAVLGMGSGLVLPEFLAFGPDGLLYVACRGNNLVYVFHPDGSVDHVFGGPINDLTEPVGITIGPDGRILVASRNGNAIVPFVNGDAQPLIGADTTLASPQGMAFSPARFRARLSGLLYRTGNRPEKHGERAILSLAPGSRTIMLTLTDNPADDGDLASIFGASAFVFPGYERFEDDDARRRLLQGTQVGEADDGLLLGSIGLSVSGKTPDGFFAPRRSIGTLQCVGPAGGFLGRIKAVRRLP